METKCGILTITIGSNYGNRLQNYALQCVIKNFGYFPETIDYTPSYMLNKKKEKNKPIKNNFLKLKKIGFSHLFNIINKKILRRKRIKEKEVYRRQCFNDFIDQYICMSSQQYDSNSDFNQLNEIYNFFIVGSDQVWNPYWEGRDEFFYLTFTNNEKKIAYAPSFGVSQIPENQKKIYQKNLSSFSNISIREEQGQKIIKNLINSDVPILLDPTFLLKKDEWDQIVVESTDKENYILTYFLGIISSKRKRKIKKFAKKNNLKIISMYEDWNPKSNFGGPSEFVGLIKNATYVCTDSFHGAVFSIIYNKPFTVMEREEINNQTNHKMNSRIETLLKNMQLQKCQSFLTKNEDGRFDISFEVANKRIEDDRKKSFEYLKKSLNIK